jgi:streptogramin lyase
VAVAPDGTVYVSDFWNQRIQAFMPNGRFLRSWAVQDWTPQSYDEPYLAIDPRTGNIVATDPGQEQVLEYTPSGTLVGAFGSSNLSVPIGVAVRPNGDVAVSDATANHVNLFRAPVVARTQAIHGQSAKAPGSRRRTAKKP